MAHPIIQAQDALKAILAARPAFADVIVADGGPSEGEDIRFDMTWFNDVQVPEDGWASLGAQRRRITFLLGFTIAVRKYGDDEHATRQRALDLFEDFMAAVKANPTLTNTVQQTGDVSGTFASAPIGPSEWGAFFTGTLTCLSKSY